MNKKLIILILIILGVFFLGIQKIYQIAHEDEILSSYIDEDKGRLDDSDSRLFIKEIPKISFYYRGETVQCAYLGITYPIAQAIYYFMDPQGRIIAEQKPIVYKKPGDSGYSQFWEIFYVHVPKRYKPNSVKAIETILKAEKDKIFRVTFSGKGVNMPIVHRETAAGGEYPQKIEGYYNSQLVTFLKFEEELLVYENGTVDAMPVLVLTKEGEGAMFEMFQGKDLTGDGDMLDSFSVVDIKKGSSSYVPLLNVAYIHVKPAFPSLGKVKESPWKSFSAILENRGEYLNFAKGKNALEETQYYINCPQL